MRFWSSAASAALPIAVVATAWIVAESVGSSPQPADAAASDRPVSGVAVPCREIGTPAPACACSALGLVPSSDPAATAALVEGAKRALDEARAAGGPDLALVVGGTSGGWSSVASETVRLACEERVVAVIGPPERALAHPAAQAATRCGVPMVSTSSAASVTAAGSKYVVSVAATSAEETPVARADLVAAGYDAARVIVLAVRRGGLSRVAVLAAMTDGTSVTGSAGDLRFGRFGRREWASK